MALEESIGLNVTRIPDEYKERISTKISGTGKGKWRINKYSKIKFYF